MRIQRAWARGLDGSANTRAAPAGRASGVWGAFDRWCLRRIADALGGAAIVVRLWDGRTLALSDEAPVGSVLIRDRATLRQLVADPALGFGEAYTDGRLEVQGDLTRLFESANRAAVARGRSSWRDWLARALTGASPDAARRNIRRHYDLGNDFYQLWLDARLVYTCAYFDDPHASLEAAQTAKLDYVSRKLALRPGETVIEAGCGWGALALHMARHYGVHVRAYNISASQLAFARARADAEGLSDRVTFVDGDYRTIQGRADAFVSVGMLEHVGPRHYRSLGDVIARVLDPVHGRGLLHFIGRRLPMPFNAWTERYIFPGAYAPTLGEVLPTVLERHRLAVSDVENLRLHYAHTIEHWQQRFEEHADLVGARFDAAFVRMWRMYLASARAGFLSGDLELFQIVFGRDTARTAPATRRALYQSMSTDRRTPQVRSAGLCGYGAPDLQVRRHDHD